MERLVTVLLQLACFDEVFAVLKADRKLFPLDEPLTLDCTKNTKLNITNVAFRQTDRDENDKYNDKCYLSNEDIDYVKDTCNNNETCSVYFNKLSIYNNCSRNYGKINVLYNCKREVKNCHFNNEWCDFRNQFGWSLQDGFISGRGYIDFFSRFNEGKLYSGIIFPTPIQCMYFWHNGNDLKLSLNDSTKHTLTYHQTGRTSKNWQQVKVPLYNIPWPYIIVFVATSTQDVGIDEVSIFNLPCEALGQQNSTPGNYLDCKMSPEGTEYQGRLNHTKHVGCQRWDSQYPHKHSFELNDEENFCRNPDLSLEGPWCYTVSMDKRYDFCDIPFCEQSIQGIDAEENFQLKECSAHYLDLEKFQVTFERQSKNCSLLSEATKKEIINVCRSPKSTEICQVNLWNFLQNRSQCFPANEIMVEYFCEEMTTANNGFQEISKETSLPEITAGVSSGLVLLGCIIVLVVCFVRRSNNKIARKKKLRQTHGTNVGLQSKALTDNQVTTSMDETGFNSPGYATNNPPYDQDINSDVNSKQVHERDHINNIYSNDKIEKGEKIKKKNKLPPRNKMKMKNDDIYADSEEGTYDVSNNVRHKEVDSNLYGHAVDLVYDTSSHVRTIAYDETYDHFHGN